MAAASARRAAGRSVETVGEAELRRFLSAAGMHDSVVSTLASNDIRSLADAKLLSTDDLKELDLPVGTRNKLMQLLDTTDLRLTVTTRSAQHLAVSLALSRVLLERVPASLLGLTLIAVWCWFERCLCTYLGLLRASASAPAQLLGLALQLSGCVCLWAGGEWAVQLSSVHLLPLLFEPSGELSPETVMGLCAAALTVCWITAPDAWRLRRWAGA